RAAINYAAGERPLSVAVGDLNGDGIPDLAVANYGLSSGTVSALLGNGDGTFQAAQSYPTGRDSTGVAVADFSGDGIPDLAVVNNVGRTVRILLGNGDGTFQAAPNYGVGERPGVLSVGD